VRPAQLAAFIPWLETVGQLKRRYAPSWAALCEGFMTDIQPVQPGKRFADLQFVKLGGSLITDKTRPHALRSEALRRLAAEIASACDQRPELHLLLGHGSGSFGHVAADRYGTRQGVETPEEWGGFCEVWMEASTLDRLVVTALKNAGLRPIAFPPSAVVVAKAGKVLSWDLAPIQAALQSGLMPVVYGDVVFDTNLGGTILSTETLFVYLAKELHPQRVLVAGLEAGVWQDYPACTRLVPEITPMNYPELEAALGGSDSTDVTGGMASKVEQLLAMVQTVPGLEALIFSGETPGVVEQALLGPVMGTRIKNR
jgi:isopentenyl phosphate kinase